MASLWNGNSFDGGSAVHPCPSMGLVALIQIEQNRFESNIARSDCSIG